MHLKDPQSGAAGAANGRTALPSKLSARDAALPFGRAATGINVAL